MKKKPAKKTRAASLKNDRTTSYAQCVASGVIVAGPHVRDACARHLRDLKQGKERGIYFDVKAANEVIEFFEEVLHLNGGEFEGIPFVPTPWQCFVLGSLFGWKRANGFRRFRVAYIETSKGQGKSPLAGGIGLFGLTADDEPRAEIYAAATKKDQAQILFRDAVAMVDFSPLLNEIISRSGSPGKEWNLAYIEKGSFFRPIASDEGQSGPRPHIALLDEVHEHRDGTVVQMMRAGTKGRRQALIVMITNSGKSRSSICWENHDYGAKVAAGMIEDDTYFSYICALDKEDDPFTDESCWIKANPNLGITIQPEYLRELVTQARGMPGTESTVKRLNFCMWQEGADAWMSAEIWLGQKDACDESLYKNRRCWGGLDLGSTQDLTSLVLVFEPTADDPYWRLKPYFWVPDEGLAKKSEDDVVPYDVWKSQGHIETTPGRAVSRNHVVKRITQIAGIYDIQAIAYDRWRVEELIQAASEEQIELPPLTPFGQGFRDMSPAISEFETRLVNKKIKHNGNPCMTWCVANAVTDKDPTEAKKFNKAKANGRIDGTVAGAMAIGLTVKKPEEKPKNKDINKHLEKHGIRRL
ncbi:MAG TPA: terminase TerL endonuclease subunit [Cellvibrionaceae bacterium]